ncbi:MAG: DUF4118 domain-containing protein [Clostridia bacterium]
MKLDRAVFFRVLKTIVLLILITACALLMNAGGIGNECIIMVYLIGVLLITVFTRGYLYGVLASLASVQIFNYFFTEPRYTFMIRSTNDLMLLVFFTITAIISGTITSRQRQITDDFARNECTAQLLYTIAVGFLHSTGESSIVEKGIAYISEYAGKSCMVTLESNADKHFGVQQQPGGCTRDFSILGGNQVLGKLRVLDCEAALSAQADLVIKTVVTQMGIALDREYIYRERENIRVLMERERLRSTLLRSVTHDLRSPLTALSGASNLLVDSYEQLSDEERKHLASDISEEMIWLSNLVENILNMTRINERRFELKRNEEVVDDVVGEAVAHMNRLLKSRSFKAILPDELLTAPMDGKLIVQVLVNLLDNAVKHTPQDSEIELSVQKQGESIVFCVADTGEGIDESVRNTLFEGFVTSDHGRSDSKRGIGLGLAIGKVVVEAHGGEIHVEPNHPKGSRFVFSLPIAPA